MCRIRMQIPLEKYMALLTCLCRGLSTHPGKWNKHIDAWDCLNNQQFPSLEAFAFTLRQLFQVAKPPNRYTPEFMLFT